MEDTIELNEKQFDSIEAFLKKTLIGIGVRNVLLIDLAGNLLISLDEGQSDIDVYSLAALAAGNFAAVGEIARLIGESDFSLLFHKGEKGSIHFNRIAQGLLLITIFGSDLSLGFVRLKVAEVVREIESLLKK